MSASHNIHPYGFSPTNVPAGYRAVFADADGTACVAAPADQESPDVRMERLQQYTTLVERLLLRKNDEISELRSGMESRVEEVQQKQAEHERVMIHQARHAAMGEILGAVAHKWRQPLNSIALITQNIEDAWKYGEMDGELLGRMVFQIMEQINLLSRTIDDFRNFIDPRNVTEHFDPVESVTLTEVLLSCWFSNFSAVDIRVTDEPAGALQVAGCRHIFQQVIFNLLCNANDAIRERQYVAGPEFRGGIAVSFARCENDIVICVEDNGGGIDDSIRERIFEPYFTTKQKTDGFGIGLYMSRLIVENSMNGDLWFENIPGGSRFSIRLPALTEERTCV